MGGGGGGGGYTLCPCDFVLSCFVFASRWFYCCCFWFGLVWLFCLLLWVFVVFGWGGGVRVGRGCLFFYLDCVEWVHVHPVLVRP